MQIGAPFSMAADSPDRASRMQAWLTLRKPGETRCGWAAKTARTSTSRLTLKASTTLMKSRHQHPQRPV